MLNIPYLRELCEKATKEPWTADVDEPDDCVVWSGTGKSAEFIGNIGDVVTPIIQDTEKARVIFDVEINNCKFIAASREALPELLDRVEALEKFKALASAYFKALEKGPDIPEDCSEEEFQERCDVFGQVTDDLFAAIIMALRDAGKEE